MLTKIDFKDPEIWVSMIACSFFIAAGIRYLFFYLPRKRTLKANAMADMLDFKKITGCTEALERFEAAYAWHLRFGHLDLHQYHAAAVNSLNRAVRHAESTLASEKSHLLRARKEGEIAALKAQAKTLEERLKENPLVHPRIKMPEPLIPQGSLNVLDSFPGS